MTRLPPPLELQRIKDTAAQILARHELVLPYPPAELHVMDHFIHEPTWSTALSDGLLDRMFPKLGSSELVHFTKPDVLPNILEKKQLWLASIAKNFDAEYMAFIKEHAYAAANSKAIRRELAECYFYGSFTLPDSASEPTHWSTFADGGNGYRLRLQLAPRAAELRNIRYAGQGKSLLTLLDDDLVAAIGRRFFPRGAAKVTAFSLRKDLSYEDEMRLLVSNPPAALRFEHNRDHYIALGIGAGSDPWCEIELLGITCGRKEDVANVSRLAATTDFVGLQIDAR